MSQCTRCGSYAINQHLHGRETGVDPHLCDVCYWRNRAEESDDTLIYYRLRCTHCNRSDSARGPRVNEVEDIMSDLLGQVGWVKSAPRTSNHFAMFCSSACHSASKKKNGKYRSSTLMNCQTKHGFLMSKLITVQLTFA